MSDKAPKDQEQKAAEAEVEDFKEDLGPFVVAADTTRMPMVFTDAKVAGNPIIFANDSFLKLTGYDRDEVLAQKFNFLLAFCDDKKAIQKIEKAFTKETDDTLKIHYARENSSEFWADVFISPVKDDKGAVDMLATKIMKGGSGVWGPVPMPANTQVSDADAKKLATWVLSTK